MHRAHSWPKEEFLCRVHCAPRAAFCKGGCDGGRFNTTAHSALHLLSAARAEPGETAAELISMQDCRAEEGMASHKISAEKKKNKS